jgi:hypothetical protein
LIVGMKVGSVMGATRLRVHPDDDPEKSRDFRHRSILAALFRPCGTPWFQIATPEVVEDRSDIAASETLRYRVAMAKDGHCGGIAKSSNASGTFISGDVSEGP